MNKLAIQNGAEIIRVHDVNERKISFMIYNFNIGFLEIRFIDFIDIFW